MQATSPHCLHQYNLETSEPKHGVEVWHIHSMICLSKRLKPVHLLVNAEFPIKITASFLIHVLVLICLSQLILV